MKHRRILHHSIRVNILVGLMLVTPVATTIVVFNFLFRLATGWMPQFLTPLLDSIQPAYLQPVFILALTFGLLFLVGVLARNLIGRRLYRLSDWLLVRIPLVRDIYVSVSRILEALFSQRKTLFKEVVIIEYPRRGIYVIGFVTAQLPVSLARAASGKDPAVPWVSLFIPTTPNPTSGVLICAPRTEVVPLNMPVQEALTFVMSAGAVFRDDSGTRITLLDRIDEWLRMEDADAGTHIHGH